MKKAFHKTGLKWIRVVALTYAFRELDVLVTAKAPCMRGSCVLENHIKLLRPVIDVAYDPTPRSNEQGGCACSALGLVEKLRHEKEVNWLNAHPLRLGPQWNASAARSMTTKRCVSCLQLSTVGSV